ncbi:MAG: hypothetical protein RL477_911 [Pseudomonadota bacterium]|jgi:hypothetical protein
MEMTTKNPVETLIFLTASLIEIMSREIDLLKNMQPQEIRDLQSEKADLARAYESCMNRVKSEPQLLALAPRPLKQQLKMLTAQFQNVLAENERALRAVKSVSERLLTVIVNAVAEKQNGASYSANGAMGLAAMNGSRPVAVSVNERL